MFPAAQVPGRAGPPDTGEVVEQARLVHNRLGEVVGNLPAPGEVVTSEDCTRLAASLRGLAKTFDRHAHSRPASPAPAPKSRVWVFPGQQH